MKKPTEQYYEVYTQDGIISVPDIDIERFNQYSIIAVKHLIAKKKMNSFKGAMMVRRMQEQFKQAVMTGRFKLKEREVVPNGS